MATKPRRSKHQPPSKDRGGAVVCLLFLIVIGYEFWCANVDKTHARAYGEQLMAALCSDQPLPANFSRNLFAALKRDHWTCDTQITVGAKSRNKYSSDTIEVVLSRPGRALQVHLRLELIAPTREVRYKSYFATDGAGRQKVNYP